MVAPISPTDPKTTVRNIDGPGSVYLVKQGYRQAKPYNLPLSYNVRHIETRSADRYGRENYGGMANANTGKSGVGSNLYVRVSPTTMAPGLETLRDQALQAARANFVKEISASSAVAVALAEHQSTLSMIERRVTQVSRALKKVKRLDLAGAAAEMSLNPDLAVKRVLRDREIRERAARKGKVPRFPDGSKINLDPRNWADVWLELWFGWLPSINDVNEGIKFLDQPIPDNPVHGFKTIRTIDDYRDSQGAWPYTEVSGATHITKVQAHVAAWVRVNNPNLYLMNRLGLLNPGAVLELVPYSWLLNWAVNLNEYFGSFTEFVGLDVVDAYHSTKIRTECAGWTAFTNAVQPEFSSGYRVDSAATVFQRELGIPAVTLGLRAPWLLSPTRAATAISLLLQGLKR